MDLASPTGIQGLVSAVRGCIRIFIVPFCGCLCICIRLWAAYLSLCLCFGMSAAVAVPVCLHLSLLTVRAAIDLLIS